MLAFPDEGVHIAGCIWFKGNYDTPVIPRRKVHDECLVKDADCRMKIAKGERSFFLRR